MRLLLNCVLASSVLAQAGDEPPKWEVLPHKMFELAQVEDDDAAERLVDGLVGIGHSRAGISASSGGGIGFSRTDDAFGKLVRMGPRALPALLKHIDDARTTKLWFRHAGAGFGGMMPSHEVMVPWGRDAELKAIAAGFGTGVMTGWMEYSEGLDEKIELRRHDVSVGDCCYAILGEILGRPYEAVRYQASAIVAVCSPTRDPRVARAMRSAWGKGKPAEVLARSLLADFHTRGPGSSSLQGNAAGRLLIYFPEQAGEMVTKRLVGLTGDAVKDGVDSATIVKAVLWAGSGAAFDAWTKLTDVSRPREIRLAALRALPGFAQPTAVARTSELLAAAGDREVMSACLDYLRAVDVDPWPILTRSLRTAEARGPTGYDDCAQLMVQILRAGGTRAVAVVRESTKGGLDRCLIVLTAAHWAQLPDESLREVVVPLLRDKTPIAKAEGVPLSEFFGREGRRVCDYAAWVLARTNRYRFFNSVRAEIRDRDIRALLDQFGEK